MNIRIIPWLLFVLSCLPHLLWSQDQTCGLENSFPLPSNTASTAFIEVGQDIQYLNTLLDDPNQGVCAVEVTFFNNNPAVLELTLVSPAGDAVQLFGPKIDVQFPKIGTIGNITFVPCDSTPEPDIGFGDMGRWDNTPLTLPGTLPRFERSYHPFNGCLEDFNSGNVNGTWQLIIDNSSVSQPDLGGNSLVDFKIIFCDESGPQCCRADAGRLFGVFEPACQGGPGPDLTTRALPIYTGRNRPDDAEYGYTYVVTENNPVTGNDDIVTSINVPNSFTGPDLTGIGPGTYTIYGLSYRFVEGLPNIDNFVSIDDLRAEFATNPAICGDITTTSFDFTILGIDIGPPKIITCDITSVTIGGPNTSEGPNITYRWTKVGGAGNIITAMDQKQVVVDGAGSFQINLISSGENCSRTITVREDINPPTVIIEEPEPLNCFNQLMVTLDASMSDSDPNINFSWDEPIPGAIIGGRNSLTPIVGFLGAGEYQLNMVNIQNGCRDSASVTVVENAPILTSVIATTDTVINCINSTIELDATGSSTGPGIEYIWEVITGGPFPDGTIRATGLTTTVDRVGTYQLVVLDQSSGCRNRQSGIVISQNFTEPTADAGPDQLIDCGNLTGILNGSASSPASDVTYQWAGPMGSTIVNGDTPSPSVDIGGTYILTVTHILSQCANQDTVEVIEINDEPIINGVFAEPFDCVSGTSQTVNIDAVPTDPTNTLTFQWNGPGIVGLSTNSIIEVNQAGTYEVTVTESGCEAVDSIIISNDFQLAIADTGLPQVIDCNQLIVQLGGATTSIGANIEYTWFTNNGNISGNLSDPTTQVDQAGVYGLIVLNTSNQCADTALVTINADLTPPLTDSIPDQIIPCSVGFIQVDANLFTTGTNHSFLWSGPCVNMDASDNARVTIDCPGTYFLEVNNLNNGCVSRDTIEVTEDPNTPIADILEDQVDLDCITGGVQVDASNSIGGEVTWFLNNDPVSISGLTPSFSQPGTYRLEISNAISGCVAMDTVVVNSACQPSLTLNTSVTPITCNQPALLLETSVSPPGPNYQFEWTSPNRCFIDASDQSSVRVSCGDQYQLVVTNAVLMISDTLVVNVTEDIEQPIAAIASPPVIDCNNPMITLDGMGSSEGPEFNYAWTDGNGNSFGVAIDAMVSAPGTYFLEVTNTANGCISTASQIVGENRIFPEVTLDNTFFPCFRDSFRINALITPTDPNYEIRWGGASIIGPTDERSLLVQGPGSYDLSILDPATGCSLDTTLVLQPSTCPPCIDINTTDARITCDQSLQVLEATFCEDCTGCNIVWTTTDGQIDAGANTLTPTISQPGSYQITVTSPNGLSDSKVVNVVGDQELPMVNVSGSGDITCGSPESTVEVVNSDQGPEYVIAWRSSTGQVVPDNTLSFLINTPGTFTAIITDITNGCIDSAQVAIGIDTISPQAAIQPPGVLTCMTQSVNIDASGSAFENSGTFTWTSDIGNPITANQTSNPIVQDPGVYTLMLEDEVNGCVSITNTEVTANLTPPPITAIEDTQIDCNNRVVLLSGNLPAPTGFDFEWCRVETDGTVTNCTSTNLDLSVATTGTYRLTIIDSQTGCTNEELVEVQDRTALPVVDAGPSLTITCVDSLVQLQGMITSAGTARIQWSNQSNNQIIDPNSVNPTVADPGVYILEAVNDSTGCVALDSTEVVINQAFPTLTMGPDTAITCLNSELTLSAIANSTSGNGSLTFQWISSEGQILSGAMTTTPVVSLPGTYMLDVFDASNGCTVFDSIIVADNRVVPTASIDDNIASVLNCTTDRVSIDGSLSASSNGPLVFQWSGVNTGASIIGSTNSPIVEVNQPGTYELIVTDQFNGCMDTVQTSIQADRNFPTVQIAPVEQITCNNPMVILDGGNSSIGGTFTTAWLESSGQTISNTLTTEVGNGGFFTLVIQNTDNGCTDSSTVFVPIDTIAPNLVINNQDQLNCIVNQVPLSVTVSGDSGFVYEWTTRDGQIVTPPNAPNIIVDQPGDYLVRVENPTNGCQTLQSTTVMLSTTEITNLNIETISPNCRDSEDGQIIITEVVGGAGPFLYAIDNDVFLMNNQFGNLNSGSYQITVQNEDGCEFSTNVDLEAPTELTVELGPDITLPIGDVLTLKPEITGQYDNISWIGDTSVLDRGVEFIEVRPFDNTLYTVTLTNNAGCRATDNIYVKINRTKSVYIPNAFYPNSDQPNNSRFTIFAKDNGTVEMIKSLAIYNRWGLLVFSQDNFQPNDPTLGWDGMFDGEALNTGMFTYTAEVSFIDGTTEFYEGDVMLMR